MNLFNWNRNHEVFLPEVDAEHRALYLAGAELSHALASGEPEESIQARLHHLALAAESHFLHEERLMKESEFESTEWHTKQHNHLRSRVGQVDPAHADSIGEFLEHLAGWLRDHTAVADRIMAAHIRNWCRRNAA